MKVALYKCAQINYETVSDESLDHTEEYIRISEFEEVAFKRLSDAETVRRQLKALDDMRDEVSRKFGKALKEIDARKASLQALTHEVAA